MKKGGESQPREGWMVRHHQHRPCLGGMDGWLVRGVTTIHASWLSYPPPPGTVAGAQKCGHVHPYTCAPLIPRSPPSSTGSASPEWFL